MRLKVRGGWRWFLLLGIVTAVSAGPQQPTAEMARQHVRDFLALARPGESFEIGRVQRRDLHVEGLPTTWSVTVNQGDQRYRFLLQEPDLHVHVLSNSGREEERRRGRGRTGRSSFTSPEAAKQYCIAFMSRVSPSSSRLVDFSYSNDVVNPSGNLVPGEVRARFSPVRSGYVYLAGIHNSGIRLDPQDRTILQYSGIGSLPATESAPTNPISRDAAIRAAFGSSITPEKAAIGYVLPQGASRARVCWWIEASKQKVFVDAGTGQVLQRTSLK